MLIRTALTVVGAGCAAMVLTRVGYRAVLFPAPRTGPVWVPPGATLRQLVAADGQAVEVLAFAPRTPGAPYVVLFHGNGETIADGVGLAQALVARGLGVWAVEYRGYGAVDGSPSEEGLYLDAAAALDALAAEGVAPERVTLWGSSLGSGVAVEMASRRPATCRALVLSTPFTSIPAVATSKVPFLPMRWLLPEAFDNLAKAPRVDVPTLVIHGDRDALVPYAHGVALAEAMGAELLTVVGGGHNDLWTREPARLLDAVVRMAAPP